VVKLITAYRSSGSARHLLPTADRLATLICVPPLSSLPPQQRAVLALIVEKGKTYDEIAALLGLEVEAVRQRAHEALSGLAPADGARPATRHRAAIGNYLLGQDPDAAPATYAYLERSVAGRDWAGALAAELAGLADRAGAELPEIPPDPDDDVDVDIDIEPEAMPESAPPAPRPPALAPEAGPEETGSPPAAVTADEAPAGAAPAVSRRGGALLIALAVVLVAGALAAFLLLRGGSSSHPPAKPAATTTTPAKLAAQITLKAARGVTARGFAAVIVRGTQRIVAIAASGLQPTSAHVAYGVWLYNSRASSQLIGFVPTVKADGKISAAAPLPDGAAAFHDLVITHETSNSATRPGQILFTGAIPAGAAG
jgi:hypothetical protein